MLENRETSNLSVMNEQLTEPQMILGTTNDEDFDLHSKYD